MRTKWQILQANLAEAREIVASMERTIDGMETQKCGLPCSGCGTVLETEADFAKHFLIPDERYLNLGDCPVGKDFN
jgi:hypothetical protein